MMRRGRVNPTCKCCNIADDPGWRTREKNDWKKEVEEEIVWVDGPKGKIPYNITTESGKELWTQMNQWHGSSVWGPVGEGIVEIEKEVTERIIALLEDQLWRTPDGEVVERFELNGHTPFLIELIRKQ